MKTKKYPELIPVANTYLGEREAAAAYETVKSGWVSSGPKVREFEAAFAKHVGAKYALAVSNGTTALHVVLAALGITHGDEVLVPSLTFISTANAALYQQAKPVLVESDPRTYNIDVADAQKKITKRTKAIIPVDMMGMPCDYDAVLKLAKKHKLTVIADSAESLGATYKHKVIGSLAPIHIFSFFPNKNITTGEGGMITTNDKELAHMMSMILNQGQDYRYHHVILGYNYRMTNVQGAIGKEQLKRLDRVIREKQKLAERYNKAFRSFRNVSVPYVPSYITQHAWYMYTISVNSGSRDRIVGELTKRNIQTRLSFPPIHTQPLYKKLYGYTDRSLPHSFESWSKLINIPIWVGMGEKRQNFVVDSLRDLCE